MLHFLYHVYLELPFSLKICMFLEKVGMPWKKVAICHLWHACPWVANRGVTRGRVAHPWKVWGEILEGRGKWWKRKKKGREREKEEEREQGKWRGKWRENCGGKFKIEGGNVWKWAEDPPFFLFFFCLSLFETTKIKFVWGVPKWKFCGEIF